MAEQHVEITAVKLGRVCCPCALNAAGDRVAANAATLFVDPAQALVFKRCTLGVRPQVACVTVAVAFANGVATGRQRDGFLIIHSHTGESFAHVMRGFQGVRVAAHTFGVDIDKAHLHSSKRVFKARAVIALALIARGAQPFIFRPPVSVGFRVPDILAAKGKAVGFKPHAFIGDGARKHDKVCPADFVAVFFLDRPQQAAGLVKVHIIRPGVKRRKALVAGACTTPAACHDMRIIKPP